VTLVSFWHFTAVRQQSLTPSIAFTSILGDWLVGFVRCVLTNTAFFCSVLRDEVCAQCFARNYHQHASSILSIITYLSVFSSFVQSFVSLRRIEKYLNAAEVNAVPPLNQQSKTVAFQSCTVTWPQDRNAGKQASSAGSTPKHKFVLVDLSLNFPQGELSLICGKSGSGKSLLLLGLLSPIQSLR
jgi:ABC-type multidrug transport system fused ATPase/permease subunit